MGKQSARVKTAGLLLSLMDPSSISSVSAECHNALISYLEALGPTETSFIDMRYGFGGPTHTYGQIAKHLGIPIGVLRQLEYMLISEMYLRLRRHCAGRSFFPSPVKKLSREEIMEIHDAIRARN
jgi:hypothetical protein